MHRIGLYIARVRVNVLYWVYRIALTKEGLW